MDPTVRVGEVFDRLVDLGPKGRESSSRAEQVLFYLVIARCDKDIGGFRSVFEQSLGAAELEILIDGLRSLDEPELADEFRRAKELLEREGFYQHRNMRKVSEDTNKQIKATGKRVGDRLWDLDQKLVALLEA